MNFAYVLTDTNEIIIFEFKLSGNNNDSSKCSSLGRFQLPGDLASPIGIASLRGAILV